MDQPINKLSHKVHPSTCNHSPSPFICKYLEKQRMLKPPIDNACSPNSLSKGPNTAIHFGDHSTRHNPFLHQLLHPLEIHFLHKGLRIIPIQEQARYISQQNELLCPQRSCNLSCYSIGINVISLPIVISCNRGNYRDTPIFNNGFQYTGIYRRNLSNKTQITPGCPCSYKLPILPTESHSIAPSPVYQRY
eukprot:Gb_05166 [translate_table: standard]